MFEDIFDMDTQFHSEVALAGINLFPADKHVHGLLNKRVGHMQFLWLIKKITFNDKQHSPLLAQRLFIMCLAFGQIKHSCCLLLATKSKTHADDKPHTPTKITTGLSQAWHHNSQQPEKAQQQRLALMRFLVTLKPVRPWFYNKSIDSALLVCRIISSDFSRRQTHSNNRI